MKTYLVKWEIDVDAKDEIDAARQALEIQRDPDSIADIFEVIEKTKNYIVDLSDYRED